MKKFPFISLLSLSLCIGRATAASAPQLLAPDRAPQVWSCSDFPLTGIPDAANPFDPDSIAVDVVFTSTSGASLDMPAFWYQPYTRALVQRPGPADPKTGAPTTRGVEVLTPAGAPGWHVRWTPVLTGAYRCKIVIARNGATTETPQPEISVGAAAVGARGFVRVEPTEKRYFETFNGAPLPLIGECLCWTHQRGTYDYDDFFTHYQQNGMNYGRLWMYETFELEFQPSERLNYNQQDAWDLDYVMNEAAQKGIYLMLCLDYHGMLMDRAGSTYWPHSAYNAANGGPCATPGDFFVNPAAKTLYEKRLRYLIARYGAEPSLMSWQLFNEINQVYAKDRPADDAKYQRIDPATIVAWHAEMGDYLHTHDPYRHLVTTSLGSATEQPAMWNLPEMDYTNYHWYSTWGAKTTLGINGQADTSDAKTSGNYHQPALMAADVTARYHQEFDKPTYISEFGTDGLTVSMAEDPNRRGLRQSLWAPIMNGSAGTAMEWSWPTVAADNLYPLWGSLHAFLAGTGFGSAAWHPGQVTGTPESTVLGDAVPGGQPFDETILMHQQYVAQSADPMVLREPGEDYEASGFVFGSSRSDIQSPMRIRVRTGQGAHLILHLNSVAIGAALTVSSNGTQLFQQDLPDKDGKWVVNEEYNQDIDVPLPAGAQDIEISNPGKDWAYYDWVKVTGALPSQLPTDVPVDAWSMTDGKTTLLWALDPSFSWPCGAVAPDRTLTGAFADLHGLADGRYRVDWWNTSAGTRMGTQTAVSRGGVMHLAITPFQGDVAAKIVGVG